MYTVAVFRSMDSNIEKTFGDALSHQRTVDDCIMLDDSQIGKIVVGVFALKVFDWALRFSFAQGQNFVIVRRMRPENPRARVN